MFQIFYAAWFVSIVCIIKRICFSLRKFLNSGGWLPVADIMIPEHWDKTMPKRAKDKCYYFFKSNVTALGVGLEQRWQGCTAIGMCIDELEHQMSHACKQRPCQEEIRRCTRCSVDPSRLTVGLPLTATRQTCFNTKYDLMSITILCCKVVYLVSNGSSHVSHMESDGSKRSEFTLCPMVYSRGLILCILGAWRVVGVYMRMNVGCSASQTPGYPGRSLGRGGKKLRCLCRYKMGWY